MSLPDFQAARVYQILSRCEPAQLCRAAALACGDVQLVMQSPLSSVKISALPRTSGPSSYGTYWKPRPRRPMLPTFLPSFLLWHAGICLAGMQICRMICLQRDTSGSSLCSPPQLQHIRQQSSVQRIKQPASDLCSCHACSTQFHAVCMRSCSLQN